MSIRFESAIPEFTVADVVKTAEYYRDVFGFKVAGYWGDPPVFAIVYRDRVELFFARANQPEVRTGRAHGAYDAYLRVSHLEALVAELRSSGAKILEGPVLREYNQTEIIVEDCNGLILCFGEGTKQS